VSLHAVDPEHPGTSSVLAVAFRPHIAKFMKPKGGAKPAKHTKTRSFFSLENPFSHYHNLKSGMKVVDLHPMRYLFVVSRKARR